MMKNFVVLELRRTPGVRPEGADKNEPVEDVVSVGIPEDRRGMVTMTLDEARSRAEELVRRNPTLTFTVVEVAVPGSVVQIPVSWSK